MTRIATTRNLRDSGRFRYGIHAIVLAFVVCTVFAMAAFAGPINGVPMPESAVVASSRYAPGRLLAAPRSPDAQAGFLAALSTVRGRSAGRLPGTDVHIVMVADGFERSAVDVLSANAQVRFAELDELASPAKLDLTGTWHLATIGSHSIADDGKRSAVTVAILDSGVDGKHPDLASHVVSGWNVVDDNADARDVFGHGTPVAGAALGVAEDGSPSGGDTGIRIMPVRITNSAGFAYWSDVAKGLAWAAEHGARVANVSLQGLLSSNAIRASAEYFRAKGGLVVVPAGNTGTLDYTAPAEAMIVVAATDQNDRIAAWSTFGEFVDLSAPGVGIYSTAMGGGYRFWSGTSMASPIVAGTAALLLSMRPELTSAQTRAALLEGATKVGNIGEEAFFGAGRIDARRALQTADILLAAGSEPVPHTELKASKRCQSTDPTVTMTPVQSAAVAAGTSVPFTVTVKNNDSALCAASTFQLTSSAPSSWGATFSAGSISLLPGASGQTTLQVTSPQGANSGSTSIGAKAVNPSSKRLFGSGTALYVVGASVPGAPTIGAASGGNGQATVGFAPPASDGGSAITSYKVTSSPGSVTASGASSPITVKGLTNGTSYTFTVVALNAVGVGPASAASNSVVPSAPLTVPDAPTIGTATAGNAQAMVNFTPPSWNGGSTITGYRAISNPAGFVGAGAGSPIAVMGLSNGTPYTFTVVAINAIGTSPASAPSNSVVPATVPGAPGIGSATPGNGQAAVAFTAPASDGGSAITSYRVVSSPGGISAIGAGSPVTVSGLTNGTSYAFSVTASNAIGTGPASGLSNSVVPSGGSSGASSYSTGFPATENPISDGGKWIGGKSVGLDWNNVQTVPGKAYASALSVYPSRYSDSIAQLDTNFTADQYAQGTVYRAAGYSPSGGHEVELLLRFQISAHNTRGYEVMWGHRGYLAIARWNGAVGDFTLLYDSGSPGIGPPVDGDVLRAEIVGNVIRVYKNGTQVLSLSDSTWTTGQPGMGFWPVDDAIIEMFGWKSYQAGSL